MVSNKPTGENVYNTFVKKSPDMEDQSTTSKQYTLQEAIEKIGFGNFQVRIALLSGLSLLADGMEIFVLSVLGPILHCEWGISPLQQASLSTVVFTGFLVGSPLLGLFADRYGRRTSLLYSSMWGLYYGALSSIAPSYSWLLVMRMFVGVGVAGQPQVINYFTEFLPVHLRAKLIMLMYVSLTVGAMIEVVLAMLIIPSFGWRWWLLASASPLIIFVLAAYWLMPESPRYLLASGNKKQTLATLDRVARTNGVTLPEGKLSDCRATPKGRFKDLFGDSSLRRTSCFLPIVWFSTVFCYYGMVLLNTDLVSVGTNCIHGLDDKDPEEMCTAACDVLSRSDYVTLLITTSSELPALLLVTILADAIGRKLTMVVNFCVMLVSCVIMCFCLPYLFMVTLLYASRGFMAGQLQLCYLYTSEVYPTIVRGLGLGSGSSIARIGALTTPFVAQVLASNNLVFSLAVYAGTGLIAICTVFLLPIETNGRPLQNY